MRAKSGERVDQTALEPPCAGHKVELQDRVEWNQVKLELQKKKKAARWSLSVQES